MGVITTGRKGKHLNNLERYHIYRISRDNLHMNGTYNDTHNPIFETLHKLYTRLQHIHTPSYVIKAGSDTQNIHKVLIQGKTSPPHRQGEEPTGREHM
jgi:hypothetical protein